MVIWLIGLSGAGKTTLGRMLYGELKQAHANTVFLDGDMVREIMGQDLGHSLEDRRRNAGRICRLCRHLDSQGIHVVCAILSVFEESHAWNRANYSAYFEVYIRTSMDNLLKRQRNGIYDKALRGEAKDVVGVDIPFKPPERPDLVLSNDGTLEDLQCDLGRLLKALPELA